MIRLFRAFVWLRWRLFVNSFKGAKRRDTLERFSRAGSVILPILLTLLLIPAMISFAAMSGYVGWMMGVEGASLRVFTLSARVMLAVMTGVIILIPSIRSVQNKGSGSARLILLPIPRRLLHLIELLADITDPWMLIIASALLALPVGFLVAGAFTAALFSFIAGVLTLGCFLALSSAGSLLLQWVYRNRRRGEVFSLVALLSLSLFGFVPMLAMNVDSAATRAQGKKADKDIKILRRIASHKELFFWTPAVPSEMYAAAVTRAADGAPGKALPKFAGMLVLGAALYGISYAAFRRILETPESAGSGSSKSGLRVRLLHLPLLSSPASAIAIAHVRAVLRTVQGKMMIYFSPLMLAGVGLVFSKMHFGTISPAFTRGGGSIMVAFGMASTLLNLHKLMLNQFALDGAGLTLQFLSPASDRDLIVGKAFGNLILFTLPSACYVVLAALLMPHGDLVLWPAAFLGGMSAYLLIAPGAAVLSALFPKAADLSKMGSSASPNGIAGIVGFFGTMFALAPPALLVTGALLFWKSSLLALALVAVWTIAAALVSMALVPLATRTLAERRENLAMAAQGR